MKTHKTLRIKKLTIDIGWYRGEDWKLFELDLLHYHDDNYFTIVSVAIAKMLLSLSWDW